MAKWSRVVFCGRSIFMAGLEASLKGREGLEVLALDPDLPGIVERLDALHADVIVLDLADPRPEFTVSILREHPGTPVIGVDLSSNTVTVLSSQRYTTHTAAELAEVLRQEASIQGDSERRWNGDASGL